MKQAQNGEPFSVRDIEVDEPTDEEDGTIVVIRELNVNRQTLTKLSHM